MKLIYSDHPMAYSGRSVFLAGPTPRSRNVPSWRPEAIALLLETGIVDTVYIPEYSTGTAKVNYLDQVEWEHAGLNKCSLILFWVPRQMDTMPALTTNIEAGLYFNSQRVMYGRPDWAVHCDYLDWLYKKFTNREPATSLAELVASSAEVLKNCLPYEAQHGV